MIVRSCEVETEMVMSDGKGKNAYRAQVKALSRARRDPPT